MNKKDAKMVFAAIDKKLAPLGWYADEVVKGGKHNKLYVTNGTDKQFVTISCTPRGGFTQVAKMAAGDAWKVVNKYLEEQTLQKV